MKKSGFTLVELLAVIAILAILVIIALPNVMSMFNNAKKSSFETEVKQIYKLSMSQWMSDNLTMASEIVYSQCDSGCNNPIKSMDARSNLNYYVKISGTGKVTELYVTDGTYQYKYSGNDLKQEDIKDIKIVAELNENEILKINKNVIDDINSGSGISKCVISGCNKSLKETELIIDGEHFYVVSSDSEKTVLLTKYVLKKDGNNYVQDSNESNVNIVKERFIDSKNLAYWDKKKAKYVDDLYGWDDSSSAEGLLSPYNNNGAAYCKSSTSSNCAYVFDSNAVNIYPIINAYVNKIAMSTGKTITGRLMKLEEANKLSVDILKDKKTNEYWLGSAKNYAEIWPVDYYGRLYSNSWNNAGQKKAIRPVIIVNTLDL